MAPLTGRVHGTTIELEEAPSTPLEGKRVRVLLEIVDDNDTLSTADQRKAWHAWVDAGPQGPIEDDNEPDFP